MGYIDNAFILWRMGAIEVKDKKVWISGKFAFKFYQQHGIPPEILEEWVNSYLRTGVFSP